MLDIGLTSTAPHFEKSGSGRVINLGSLSGKRVASNVGYAMTKFAVVALTHGIRREGRDAGIRADVGLVEVKVHRARYDLLLGDWRWSRRRWWWWWWRHRWGWRLLPPVVAEPQSDREVLDVALPLNTLVVAIPTGERADHEAFDTQDRHL